MTKEQLAREVQQLYSLLQQVCVVHLTDVPGVTGWPYISTGQAKQDRQLSTSHTATLKKQLVDEVATQQKVPVSTRHWYCQMSVSRLTDRSCGNMKRTKLFTPA